MNELTQRHRAQQLLLRRAVVDRVEQIWPALQYDDLDRSFPRFAAVASQAVSANRQVSAGLAASYLRQFRRAQRVNGALPLVLAEPLPPEQLGISLAATTVAPIKTATAKGVAGDVAMQNALTLAKGSLARLVLNAGRDTVMQTVTADPQAHGYQRVLGGGGCDFCRMLAGRGAVYSEGTASFDAHDHCGCTAEPVYRA